MRIFAERSITIVTYSNVTANMNTYNKNERIGKHIKTKT